MGHPREVEAVSFRFRRIALVRDSCFCDLIGQKKEDVDVFAAGNPPSCDQTATKWSSENTSLQKHDRPRARGGWPVKKHRHGPSMGFVFWRIATFWPWSGFNGRTPIYIILFPFFIVRYELKMKCHNNLLSPFFVTFFISYFAPYTSSFFRGIVLWTTGERYELEHVRGVHSLSFGSRPSVEWLTQVTTAFAFHNHKRRTIFFLLFFISRYLPLYRIISTISSATCFVFCRCRDGGQGTMSD